MTSTCRICGNTNNNTSYEVFEKMLATGDKFSYFQCGACDCLQIARFPRNISDYYPENYYSFNTFQKLNKARPLRGWFDKHRVDDELYKSNIIGKLSNLLSKKLDYIPYIKPLNIAKDDSILDIGCGTGRLLQRMAMGGFTNLTGLDPFIDKNISYDSGVNIIKSSIKDFCDTQMKKIKVIMLHHSFEHMPDPHDILNNLKCIMDKDSIIILRIPLVDSYAWDEYKENWVQLDAPRHFFLYSRKSLTILLGKSGLKISRACYDSSKFQFIGSELYINNISLNSSKKVKKIFSRETIKMYERKAAELNRLEKGDQAIFYITIAK